MRYAWDRREKYKSFGGKARRKERTRKTKARMGGWDQNGPQGDWLRGVEWVRMA
jgi:hypothetical protein